MAKVKQKSKVLINKLQELEKLGYELNGAIVVFKMKGSTGSTIITEDYGTELRLLDESKMLIEKHNLERKSRVIKMIGDIEEKEGVITYVG
jgi:hypothetical protein